MPLILSMAMYFWGGLRGPRCMDYRQFYEAEGEEGEGRKWRDRLLAFARLKLHLLLS